MRILYISNNSSVGGAPAALLNLVRVLKDRHEVAVMMPDADGPLFRAMEEMGVKCYTSVIYCLSIWPRVINPFKYARRIRDLRRNRSTVREYVGRVLDEFMPDIVHTNVGPLDIAADECRKRKIPHVWHLREYQDLDFGMRYFPGGASAFREMIRQENNHCIAITRDILRHWNPAGDSKVIYDGVFSCSSDLYQPAQREGWFLYAARIEKGKGLMNLLAAFREYKRAGGKYRLLVAGRPCGIYAHKCRLFVKVNSLTSEVDFLGNRSDVFGLMRKASAFVMPSLFEGFGFTTAEAMYNRCIVIGHDTAGTREQFDNGLKIKGRNIALRYKTVPELTRYMHFVEKGDESLELMREDAYDVVTSLYTAEKCASEVENYYKSVLGYEE